MTYDTAFSTFWPLIPLMIAYGVAEYVDGRDILKKAGWPTRSIYAVWPALALVAWLIGGLPQVLLSIGWAFYRSLLGWNPFHNKHGLNPQTPVEVLSLVARNLVSSLFIVVPTAMWLHTGWIFPATVMGVYSVWAALVNWGYYRFQTTGDPDEAIDRVHGIGMGAVVFMLGLSSHVALQNWFS